MNDSSRTIDVGVIGMGFMGWRHAEAYLGAAGAGLPCRVVAICDPDAARRKGPTGAGNIGSGSAGVRSRLGDVAEFERAEDLLASGEVGLVSVCTPTDSHTALALAALSAGKHVLVEKPVGLGAAAVRPVAEAARRASTLCMPAHCMRFWPGWDWLRDRIRDGRYGRLISCVLHRSGATPGWSPEFYGNADRSGGVLGDFHIHDADFVLWAIGRPSAVCCVGTGRHVTALYRFGPGGPEHVAAEAAWTRTASAGFRMRFSAAFERATVEYEMGRTPALVAHDESGSNGVPIAAESGYDLEVRSLVSAIAQGRRDLRATMDDALAVATLLDAERRSLRDGAWVEVGDL